MAAPIKTVPRKRLFSLSFLVRGAPPGGRFAMLRTDLDTPLLMGPSTAARLSHRCLCLCFPGILFVSCALFGATQCSAQDVAEAARQERSQKESKQKKSDRKSTRLNSSHT